MKVRGARRFREQKWLLDAVVSTIGLDWDLLRMATVTAPIGFPRRHTSNAASIVMTR